VIPDEAVEAGARVTWIMGGGSSYDWDQSLVPEWMKTNHLDAARTILEAAAPAFASVWHEAVSGAYVDGALGGDQADVMWKKNPYRGKHE
jgi:hypothetical protein